MAKSLSKVVLHLVFSTKGRRAWLDEKTRPGLHAYLVGVFNKLDCPVLEINSVEDHIHIMFHLSRNISIATLVREVKCSSSKWLKARSPGFKLFSWQTGYGIFSVSYSLIPRVKRYIENQAEHHRKTTFQDEYRGFLDQQQIPYDEQYLWD